MRLVILSERRWRSGDRVIGGSGHRVIGPSGDPEIGLKEAFSGDTSEAATKISIPVILSGAPREVSPHDAVVR